jgi:hypothetical protein
MKASPGVTLRLSVVIVPMTHDGSGDDLRLDLEIGRDVQHAQRLLHDLAEHRCGHVAAVVDAVVRLVDHHRDDDARAIDRRHADEPGAVLVAGVLAPFLLVRGARLAAHRIADGLRLGGGAARACGQAQHLAHRARGLGSDHAQAGRGGCVLLEHRHRDHLAVACEHGVGARELEQAGRQAVAVAHRRLLDRAPGLVRTQPTAHRAGELQLRSLAEADLRVQLPHLAPVHLHRQLDGADVTRLLDHLGHRQRAVRMRVADRAAGDGDAAGRRADRRGRRDAARLERPGDDEGFHRRAGLEGVGQRAVAQLRAGEVAPFRGVEARVVGQRQHLAGGDVEHHRTAGLGLVFDHRVAQALVGEELDLGVDREADIEAVDRRDAVADVLHHAAQAVLDHVARTVLALQLALERELDAFLALFVGVGEAHQVCCRFAFRVLAAVLARLVQALDVQGLDALPHRFVDLARQPDEARFAVAELLLDVGRRQPERTRELALLLARGLHVLGDGPDRRHRHRGGQQRAMAVGDAAAVRGQFQLVRVALLALLEVEAVVDDLDHHRTADQQARAQADQDDDELAAPGRRLGRQQRARRVAHAAAHGADVAGARERDLHRATPDVATSAT